MKSTVSVILISFFLFFSLSCSVHAVDVLLTSDSGFTFSSVLDFIKDIFVPKENYFNNQIAKLNDNVNKKLGGVAYLYHLIESFFNTLLSAPSADFSFSVPDGFFGSGFKGAKFDFFHMAKPFIRLLRTSFTAFVCLITAVVCYRKIVKLFEK